MKGYVREGGASLYDVPSLRTAAILRLPTSTQVEVLETHGDFYAVRLYKGSAPLYARCLDIEILSGSPQWSQATKAREGEGRPWHQTWWAAAIWLCIPLVFWYGLYVFIAKLTWRGRGAIASTYAGILASVFVASLGVALFSGSSGGEARPSPPSNGPVQATVLLGTTPEPADRVKVVTNVSTEYYTIQGSTTQELFASIEANGLLDDNGERAQGLTEAAWQYVWTNTLARNCALTLTMDIVVTLPRLAAPARLSASLLEKWEKFSTDLATHEQTHVDLYVEGAEDIESGVEAILASPAPCSSLVSGVESVLDDGARRIQGDQEKFHADEESRLATLTAPLEAEIQSNEARLAQLATQIEALEADLGSLENQADTLDSEMNSLEGEIASIEAMYPDEFVPDPVYTQYENLLRQYNSLVPRYNSLLEEYDSLFARYSSLVDEHGALVAATNELVEQLNWTQ